MPVKGGKIVIDPGVNNSITGLGFCPDLILFFWAGTTVEDSVESLGGVIGFGWVCRSNGQPGTFEGDLFSEFGPFPPSSHTHEEWHSNRANSFFQGEFLYWVPSSPASGGHAYGIRALELDGFTIAPASDAAYGGGGGHILYYLAFGEEDELFTQKCSFTVGVDTVATPFPPLTGFSVGTGGLSPGIGGSVGFADADLATWAFTNVFDPEAGGDITALFMQRGLTNGSSVATMMNNIDVDLSDFRNNQLYADRQLLGGGLDEFGQFSHFADETHYYATHSHPDLGFIADSGRLSVAAVGGLIGKGGQVTPSSTIGGEVEVSIPFDVIAVLFQCPSYRFYTDFTEFVVGGTGFGFATPDYQAVTMVGADWNTSMCRFQSHQYSWVSNITQPVGGAPSCGTTEITPNGFKIKTATNSQPMQAIQYMAYGFISEAPGFFRIT